MKLPIYILILLTISCSTSEKRVEKKLLGELRNDQGLLIRKAESGWIPGEDIWLKITKYDTAGNIVEEYGARPYGTKYKDVFTYDDKNRPLQKLSYLFSSKGNESGEFENYGPKDAYELEDTLVDWSVTNKQLDFKTLFSYDDESKVTRERQFGTEIDSLTNELKELLTLDTLYKSNKLDSLNE